MSAFSHQDLFELAQDTTPYRLLTKDFVRTEKAGDCDLLVVEREGLIQLAVAALRDVNFLFRPGHLAKLRGILEDPEASDNDRFVAMTELRNAGLPVSLTENLDAMEAVQHIPIEDREAFKYALGDITKSRQQRTRAGQHKPARNGPLHSDSREFLPHHFEHFNGT